MQKRIKKTLLQVINNVSFFKKILNKINEKSGKNYDNLTVLMEKNCFVQN